MTVGNVAFWLLGLITLGGAIGVLLAREVIRMVVALGAFLLGVAGFYLYFGLSFLSVAQVFLYVGGVLVLVLFALMVVRRSTEGRMVLASRHDVLSAIVAAGVPGLVIGILWEPCAGLVPAAAGGGDVAALSAALLGEKTLETAQSAGSLLPHFEVAGVLLLVALVAVVVVSGEEDA